MSITPKAKQSLKAQAHQLKPIILIGNNGVTDAVNAEVERALNDHELIKIRVHTNDREIRRAIFAEICQVHQAELVQVVGKIGVIYRQNMNA